MFASKYVLSVLQGEWCMISGVKSHKSLKFGQWYDAISPRRLVDTIQKTSYEWIYNEPNDFLPIRIFVEGKKLEELGIASDVWGADKEFFLVAYDQVGSLRGLINSAGKVVKRIDYDSLGNILYDSLPDFFIPQGFASGMTDRFALYLRKARSSPRQAPLAPVGQVFTGLVKFGYRYYDPQVGRFITKDNAYITKRQSVFIVEVISQVNAWGYHARRY